MNRVYHILCFFFKKLMAIVDVINPTHGHLQDLFYTLAKRELTKSGGHFLEQNV